MVSDADGLPDDWEKSNGLNPHDPKDSSEKAKGKQGYTNIEVFINQLGGFTKRF
ncbi:hypothetical protein OCK74_06955 [Chitinophagaceae bacterium LB-8]|uniref:Uncharacterized protein n=1 Tax=Paraflavisolibacter caeni TaxID=2982496 RepID=A0A9X2XU09_9BACT|nr:hypothetical protein [Paraflavisolibacter caeni]MCU7548850.1 hypothetical protein [Paraflavisolibacter caeni]